MTYNVGRDRIIIMNSYVRAKRNLDNNIHSVSGSTESDTTYDVSGTRNPLKVRFWRGDSSQQHS